MSNGWSKHGSSIIPSRHSMPQDLYSPCLNLANYARTMFTPTMFTLRRRVTGRVCLFTLSYTPNNSNNNDNNNDSDNDNDNNDSST